MMRIRARTCAGFTLIELLVAVTIVGVIAVLAMGGLNEVITQDRIVREQMDRLTRLQRAVRYLTTDLAGLQPRFVRDVTGDSREPPLAGGVSSDYLVRLTRGGWSNPAGLPRGTLQRVQYRIEDDALIREYLPVLDPGSLVTEPRREVLLEEVNAVKIYYLDRSRMRGSDPWLETWPPPGSTPDTPQLPVAIRIVFDLPEWGEIERIVETGG